MLKRLQGIDKASECKEACVQTDGCTIFLINALEQECKLYPASTRTGYKRERMGGSIIGKLNCELEEENTDMEGQGMLALNCVYEPCLSLLKLYLELNRLII